MHWKRYLLVGVGGVVLGILLSVFASTRVKGHNEMRMAPEPSMAPVATMAPPPPPPAPEMDEKEVEERGSAKKSAPSGAFAQGLRGGSGNPSVEPQFGGPGSFDEAKGGAKDGAEQDASPPGRAWFPETFLFEPLVVTDASGAASVPVKVPDRLTSWRVLALAHSRSGAQAGAVSTFASALPTYVDPVVPPFLRAGDVVRLPIQVVNTTSAAVTRALKVEARGASVEGGARTVTVPAGGSALEYVTVRAPRPGPVTVRAALEGMDSVERTFDVWPTGRRVSETRGGTLAAPRSLEVEGPASPLAGSERVRLLVFPGALGVLRSELASAPSRPGVEEEAYALLLAGRAPALLQSLGGTMDASALERTSRLASQRVLRAGRAPDVAMAALLAEAALAHPGDLVLTRLGERLSDQVARAQRPDGTCQGGEGWTLQRVMVATADCTRVVLAGAGTDAGKRRASAFGARASGAFERSLSRVRDGYTAAAALASGGVSGSLREELRARVRGALKRRPDGAAYLPVDKGVVRADGRVPSEAEATALAVLALVDDKEAPLADLGASLLADYRPESGWGDGRTNLMGLQAALALFREPLPAQVRVVLERDGKAVTEGTFDAQALREVLTLEADAEGSAGRHAWTVRAEPAVPGLGFTLMLGAYVPWQAGEPGRGLELKLEAVTDAKVGQAVAVVLQGASPSGVELTLRQELPAGVQVDAPSLDALVREGRVGRYEVEDGAVRLTLPPRGAAVTFDLRFRVIPTLAGTLQAGAASLGVPGREDQTFRLPPSTWTVR